MFCTACGVKNAEESNFCRQCGHKLEKTPPKISEAEFDRALPAEEQLSALLERAYRLRRAGDLPAAVALCEEALRLKPDSTSAHSLRGQLYELNGEREQAIREYERVLQLNPGSIADRVKLDELRGDGRPVAPLLGTKPTVVLAEPTSLRASGRTLLLGGMMGLALMAVGGALALQMHGRPTGTAATLSGSRPLAAPVMPSAVNSPGASAVAAKPTGPDTNKEPSASHWAYQAVDQRKGAPVQEAASNTPRSVPSPGAPGIVYVPVLQSPRMLNAVPESKTRIKTIPVRQNIVSAANAARNNDSLSGNRVVLPADDADVTQSSNGHIIIKVPASKSAAAPAAGTPKTNPGKGSGYISIRPAKSASGGNSFHPDGGGASGGAQGDIALGDQYKLQEQFGKAVAAYRRALPSAGDQAGFVNQQIAWCYQQQGNTTSAKTFYQSAVAEYQKLEGAGRLTETGRAGLRFCEQGIKTCDSL